VQITLQYKHQTQNKKPTTKSKLDTKKQIDHIASDRPSQVQRYQQVQTIEVPVQQPIQIITG
jgi:hypothetical protein